MYAYMHTIITDIINIIKLLLLLLLLWLFSLYKYNWVQFRKYRWRIYKDICLHRLTADLYIYIYMYISHHSYLQCVVTFMWCVFHPVVLMDYHTKTGNATTPRVNPGGRLGSQGLGVGLGSHRFSKIGCARHFAPWVGNNSAQWWRPHFLGTICDPCALW